MYMKKLLSKRCPIYRYRVNKILGKRQNKRYFVSNYDFCMSSHLASSQLFGSGHPNTETIIRYFFNEHERSLNEHMQPLVS